MKSTMPDCSADLLLKDEAYPEDTSAHADQPLEAPAEVEPAILQVPQLATSGGRYAAEISRQNPGCLLFLVDQSGSMEEPIAGGTGEKKKQVVADALNRLLYNTVLRCAKEDGVRPYFDIGVWSYGGNEEVVPAFGVDLLSIKEIADKPKRTEMRKRRLPDGAGGVYEEEFQLPVWFDPIAFGKTPMHAAFTTVLGSVTNWLGKHTTSFPPIILNLTDGAYTGENPAPVAQELMRLNIADGHILLFNCHISRQAGLTVAFPDDAQAAGFEGLARELYDISSPLPEPMRQQALAKGYQTGLGARGYAFNADLVTLIDFLDIGTRVIQDRVEAA
jgi:hypothetical protein